MLNAIALLGQVVPDLTWKVNAFLAWEDGRFVGCGVAAGTPIGPCFGVETSAIAQLTAAAWVEGRAF